MKLPQEEVDRLIEQYLTNSHRPDGVDSRTADDIEKINAIHCAINDVENTIKALDDLNKYVGLVILSDEIQEKTKVRDILKNKLK